MGLASNNARRSLTAIDARGLEFCIVRHRFVTGNWQALFPMRVHGSKAHGEPF
jgi:hypothetical protein